jgi:uncharacterized Fe-S radical SAM superfamily protein PflX
MLRNPEYHKYLRNPEYHKYAYPLHYPDFMKKKVKRMNEYLKKSNTSKIKCYLKRSKTRRMKCSLSSKPVEKKEMVSVPIYNQERCTRGRPSKPKISRDSLWWVAFVGICKSANY